MLHFILSLFIHFVLFYLVYLIFNLFFFSQMLGTALLGKRTTKVNIQIFRFIYLIFTFVSVFFSSLSKRNHSQRWKSKVSNRNQTANQQANCLFTKQPKSKNSDLWFSWEKYSTEYGLIFVECDSLIIHSYRWIYAPR